ncbi:MAG: hypothetical protein O7H40_15630 [Gammaproteobacteria bacterium]|nr:hypothetical protein [Gammaproteobacteria bacterium]
MSTDTVDGPDPAALVQPWTSRPTGPGPLLRIAMLTNLFHPVATGSATQILGSSRELASFGHHVVVVMAQVDPSTPDYEVMGGFKISRLPRYACPGCRLR